MVQLKGIDVSEFQGVIDWNKVKNSGIQFAIIRSGYGKNTSQKDKQFENNYIKAKQNGMPIGTYHYSYAQNVEDAKLEAKFFLDNITGKKFEYPVMFDIEDESQKHLSNSELTQIALTFCGIVEKAGYYTMMYASLDWIKNRLDMSILGRFDLWLAEWGNSPTYKGNIGIWQYTNVGKVDGIIGNVDMDIAYKDYSTTTINSNIQPVVVQPVVVKPIPQPVSTSSPTIAVGTKVKVNPTAQKYATGEDMASFVKGSVYTVSQTASDKVLLSGIMSWVKICDVTVVNSVATPPPVVKPVAAAKPVVPSIKVGSKIKMTGKKYITGENIPFWAKLRTYDVLQVKTDRILVGVGKAITGWIYIKEAKKV
ncbi:MAG TPA: glycoside hydrolase family 25 protein [Candidatus Paceibacterota bacterium]